MSAFAVSDNDPRAARLLVSLGMNDTYIAGRPPRIRLAQAHHPAQCRGIFRSPWSAQA
jgi:hypothetical protein